MTSISTTERSRPVSRQGPTGPPSVLAIVVTHDGRQWIRDCLVSLNTQTYPVMDVLVIDDASPDYRRPPRLKRIAKRHLRRHRWGYLRTRRPLGFGGAINWALSRVRTDADLLLFIHDDVALDRTSVEQMVRRVLADEQTAIVGPKVVAWEDPRRLEEVGMAADRFGYPYKGLEEGEIDLGQHDSSAEVFYVTSTCMLVRHEVFRHLGGWDARMRAFAEDLDLCWRARLAGHVVRVEPEAKARHAIALAAGLRRSPFRPQRYFIRRNRLRTVIKNASGFRLLILLPQFVLLALVEMVGFIVLRQPREILNLARALVWNFFMFPQTLTQRARVQRRRRVPDRKLRRLSVRETTRFRSYVEHQAHRMEEAWGRRAELLARQSARARATGSRLFGWPGVIALTVLVVLLVGFRHFLWSPPTSVGELLPYPERATALWRTLVSPWQPAGLGYAGPAPPAFGLLGIFPVLTLGAAGAAQKLLVLSLLAIAFVGAYNLVSEVVDRPARVVAGLSYVFGPVGYAALREGRLGALAFAAAAPFVLSSIVRFTGWARPPGWRRGRGVAVIALGAAVSAAFVPGSLLLYLLAAVLLTVARSFLDRRLRPVRGLVATMIGLTAGWGLLLPWSATWFEPGGVGEQLTGSSRDQFAATFRDHGMASVALGQTPEGPALFGLALPLLGVVALLLGEGQRRRVALALWTVVAGVGWVVGLTSSGVLAPVVASPTEAGVPAALAFSCLAGIALGAFRLDLPRRGLGIVHAGVLGALAAAAFLAAVGIGPAAWKGDWTPAGPGHVRTVDQVRALLGAEAEQTGAFRTLWIGESWGPGPPTAARPHQPYLLTGSRGQVLADLFEVPTDADGALERVIASIAERATDRGGSLLGAFNVRFVVVERGAGGEAWLSQRDLALVREEPDYLLLEVQDVTARAGLYVEVPPGVSAVAAGRLEPASSATAPAQDLTQVTAHTYSGPIHGPGTLFLAESNDPRWRASVDGQSLPRAEAGWANSFTVSASEDGNVDLVFPRSKGFVAWLIGIGLAWIVVVGAAFSIGAPARPHRRHVV